MIVLNSKAANGRGDPTRRSRRIFMLPNSDGAPSRVREKLVGLSVPCPVSINLRAPEVTVRARGTAMVRAAVPEATINEDSDTSLAEDQIGGSPHAGKRSGGHAVAQALSM